MRSFNLSPSDKTIFWGLVGRITRTDGVILRIAQAEQSLTIDGETFTPLPGCSIDATKHIINGEMPSTQINFAHSVGGVIDTEELQRGFWDGATVQTYIIDRNNISTLGDPLFTGTIQPVTLDPAEQRGSFDCRGLAVNNDNVTQTYQPMCRTDLFSSLCQLNSASFAKACTVATIEDLFNITVTVSSPPADGYYQGGTGETDTGFKFEIADDLINSTGAIKLYLPVCFARFEVGQDLTIYPGCAKTPAACLAFGNKINYQGEDHFLGVKSIRGV